MTLQRIDHVVQGSERVITHNNQENFQKMLKIFLEESNELEDTLLLLADCKNIDKMSGVWLDYIGGIVGVPRSGMSDASYREALRLHISINSSEGTPASIISLVRQYTNSDTILLSEGSVAWASLYLNGKTNIGTSLYSLVEDIKPTATKFIIHSDFNDNALLWAYESDSGASENFQVTQDGGTSYSNFKVRLSNGNTEDFFVRISSKIFSKPTTARNSFPYEVATPFKVRLPDGSEEDFYTRSSSGESQFKLRLGEKTLEERPWTWEVTKNSLRIKEPLDLFLDATEDYLESSIELYSVISEL
ncbi:hypothetical protein NVP1101O_157 [Vibrio phage 1.101.O._10N.261.45.C6]|nr:hypothetical protein NVP1101O_157 [Vibrio phage 1.101.O._10N.261.45.C6]